MYTYRLKEGAPIKATAEGVTLPGFGVVVDGIIKTNEEIENPNFELVSKEGQEQQSPSVQDSQAHLNGVVSQSEQTALPPQQIEQPVTPQSESEGNL